MYDAWIVSRQQRTRERFAGPVWHVLPPTPKSCPWLTVRLGAFHRETYRRRPPSCSHEGLPGYPEFSAVGRAFQAGHFRVAPERDPHVVMVVYGHNETLRQDAVAFLLAVGLRPLEWQTIVNLPRERASYTGEAVMRAIELARAVLVLFTPDAEVRADAGAGAPYFQARPNVFFECGLALAAKPEQTIIADCGAPLPASDVFGRHVVHLERGEAALRDLAHRLERAGCAVNLSGEDWLRCRLGDQAQRRE